MARFILCIAVLICSAQQLQAGAWPRGKGRLFLSEYVYAAPSGVFMGAYSELGLSKSVTAGLDFGRSVSGDIKIIVFLRKSWQNIGKGHQLAFELGAGTILNEKVLRPSISWGKGGMWGDRVGWLAVEGGAELRLDTGQSDVKLDFTAGVSLSPRRKLILQLQSGRQYGDPPFLRFVPSIWIGGKRHSSFEVGLTQSLLGGRETGLKLAIWQDF